MLAAALVTIVAVIARDAAAGQPLCSELFENSLPVQQCVYGDLSTRVTNLSNVVISVSGVTPGTQMSPIARSSTGVSDLASSKAVPTSCSVFGPCLLAPGRSLAVQNPLYHPYRWAYSLDFRYTVARNATLALLDVAKRRFYAPTRSTTLKAAQCAVKVALLVRGPNSWSNDVFDGVSTLNSCKSWWESLGADPGQEEALARETVGSAETEIAGGEKVGGWIFDLEFIGKIFHP